YFAKPLRLHGKDKQRTRPFRLLRVRVRLSRQRCLAIAFKHADSIFRVKLFATICAWMAAKDLICSNESFSQQPGDDCFGHYAATNECEASVLQWVRCFGLLPYFSRCHMSVRKYTLRPHSIF